MPHLIVVYGAPLTGKTALARSLAGALDAKAAVVSTDALFHEAIVRHDRDAFPELEMVYTQARLLVANYLKNRYHVVLEGAFIHELGGALHRHEQEIDQTLGLMRNLAPAPLIVRLSASEATMRRRADALGHPGEIEAILRVAAAYRPRYGSRALELSTDEMDVGDVSEAVLERLLKE